MGGRGGKAGGGGGGGGATTASAGAQMDKLSKAEAIFNQSVRDEANAERRAERMFRKGVLPSDPKQVKAEAARLAANIKGNTARKEFLAARKKLAAIDKRLVAGIATDLAF